jgi:hypothetical protein
MKTILITGASSGIGKATALRFQSEGWNVIATMRDPAAGADLALDNVLVAQLDVTDAGPSHRRCAEGIARFGRIDALLNNAGYGAYGPLEAFSTERIHRQFDTNVIGLLEVTKAVLPHMRANRVRHHRQHLVHRRADHLPARHALPRHQVRRRRPVRGAALRTRAARHPGADRRAGDDQTDFGGRSFDFAMDETLADYAPTAEAMGRLFGRLAANPSAPEVVAEVIWQAVDESGDRLRFRAGPDAEDLLDDRKAKDDATFIGGIKALMGN